jgi:hypothetical protein
MTPKNAIALLVQTVFVLRMPVLTMLALAVGLTLPSEAGEKTYTAGDIIAHFAAAGDEPVTRGLCVGSDEECGRAEKKAPSFDLEINFAKDSAELDPDAQGKLLQFSLALRDPRLQNLRFAVEGFTDASGPARTSPCPSGGPSRSPAFWQSSASSRRGSRRRDMARRGCASRTPTIR